MKIVNADEIIKSEREGMKPYGDDFAFPYIYRSCCLQSPCTNCELEAFKIANKRPLQKPLTLEEVKEQVSVWIEYSEKVKFMRCTEPVLYICSGGGKSCFDEGYSEQFRLENKEYGEMWRCWERKPTDEEMSAAKWNEILSE